jgi:hypothetical protein
MKKLIAVALGAAAFFSCSEQVSDSPDSQNLVARFDEFEITLEELDARILALPPAERPAPGEDLDAWLTEQIRQMVVERQLLAEARTSGVAQ